MTYLTIFILLISSWNTRAQIHDSPEIPKKPVLNPPKRFYLGSDLDAAIFGTSLFKKGNADSKLTTLRFSYILNLGLNFNYDVSNSFGLFTGVGIKNIGFIEKDSVTIKRRVYTVGLPIGVKIGNLSKRNFAILGAGVDMPLNYREKRFTDRNDKDKFNEWFSSRTPDIMPYIFAGASVKPGITFKFQYYVSNFFNTSYSVLANNRRSYPYASYDARLLLLSVGFDIHYKRWPKPVYIERGAGDDMEEDEDDDMDADDAASDE